MNPCCQWTEKNPEQCCNAALAHMPLAIPRIALGSIPQCRMYPMACAYTTYASTLPYKINLYLLLHTCMQIETSVHHHERSSEKWRAGPDHVHANQQPLVIPCHGPEAVQTALTAHPRCCCMPLSESAKGAVENMTHTQGVTTYDYWIEAEHTTRNRSSS
jgi:hypothetical protein